MLWALLITLLITKLAAGPEEIFMIPKLDKEIKAHIVDKDRKAEIITVAKEAKKEIKALGKVRKEKLKTIKKLGMSKDVPSEDLMVIFEEYQQARLKMQSSLIEKRLKIQELISQDEWKQLIETAILPSEKAKKKIQKGEEKEDDKVEKILDDIRQTIVKEVEDPTRQQHINSSLDKFSNTLKQFIEEGQQMNFRDNKLVRSRNTTREDLEDFYKRQNDLRYKGTIEYFSLRDAAIKHTTDDEWKAIVKTLNSIIKS